MGGRERYFAFFAGRSIFGRTMIRKIERKSKTMSGMMRALCANELSIANVAAGKLRQSPRRTTELRPQVSINALLMDIKSAGRCTTIISTACASIPRRHLNIFPIAPRNSAASNLRIFVTKITAAEASNSSSRVLLNFSAKSGKDLTRTIQSTESIRTAITSVAT